MALPPIYDPEAVKPMEEELHLVGVKSLRTPEEVEQVLAEPGTTMLIVNSVCGCAAGGARPGVMISLQNGTIPDRMVTVFAGVDRDAVECARSHLTGVMPSSPCIALFKNGEPVHVLERGHIEQMDATAVAGSLAGAYDKHCRADGPSIPAEQFAKIQMHQQCGSNIPIL